MAEKGVTEKDCRFLEISQKGKLTFYKMYFESISAVELFLSSNPPINKAVFVTKRSESGKADFAGPPLEDAIRFCVGGYDENYSQFLTLSKQLDSVNYAREEIRSVEPSVVGHRPNVPAYIADAPKCMYRTRRVQEKKLINVFMQVTYDQTTTETQILYRGILALNLIRLLEMNGYIVHFRLFETSMVYNEIFICEVVLKRQSEKLDPRKCYYPMCGKAFVRRVLLRIKESMPFTENWHLSYGKVVDEAITKKLLNIGPNDIYIGTPKEMGIVGSNMFEDANVFLSKLGLDKEIKVPKY